MPLGGREGKRGWNRENKWLLCTRRLLAQTVCMLNVVYLHPMCMNSKPISQEISSSSCSNAEEKTNFLVCTRAITKWFRATFMNEYRLSSVFWAFLGFFPWEYGYGYVVIPEIQHHPDVPEYKSQRIFQQINPRMVTCTRSSIACRLPWFAASQPPSSKVQSASQMNLLRKKS